MMVRSVGLDHRPVLAEFSRRENIDEEERGERCQGGMRGFYVGFSGIRGCMPEIKAYRVTGRVSMPELPVYRIGRGSGCWENQRIFQVGEMSLYPVFSVVLCTPYFHA